EFENIFSISFLLNLLILKIEKNAVYILIPFAYFSFTYFITYKFLKSRAYLDDFSNGKNTYVHNSKILDFFDIYGQTSNFILLEFKLIWRNKRPKTFVYTSLLLLLFGFKFYSSGVLNYDILIYFGTIVTSIFMIQYGQFIFSWESSYFNFILSKSNLINYITAKYWFFIIINFICFICSCVYSIFGLKILLFNTCLFFFNIGFTSYIILVLGLLNGRKIDFNRSAFFNYEGFSFHQVFIVVISLLSPKLINLGFNYFNLQSYSIYFIGVIGVLGFSYRKLLLSVIFKLFVKRKYILSENFRN
ncbi:MAG: DUF5687 family protein, partial [Bacteroidetes bacterium]|nr:DUF5687 family protein [Bacteroidota bacterium]